MLGAGLAELTDLLDMVNADPPRMPEVICRAVAGLYTCRADLANGGLDQFVWNHGAEVARSIGMVWRAVGAISNGELLCELADALPADPQPQADTVAAFMAFRAAVGGPDFDVPEVADELAEALLEWAAEHPEALGLAPAGGLK